MTAMTGVHSIDRAEAVKMAGFDTVKIYCKGDQAIMASVTLFLPPNSAQAVADAINAAVAKPEGTAEEEPTEDDDDPEGMAEMAGDDMAHAWADRRAGL